MEMDRYYVTNQLSTNTNVSNTSEYSDLPPIQLRANASLRTSSCRNISLRHSLDLTSYSGEIQSEIPADNHSHETRNQRWSLAYYDSSLVTSDDHCSYISPPISAHNYNTQFYSNSSQLDYPMNQRCRFSTPILSSHNLESSQDTSEFLLTPQLSCSHLQSGVENSSITQEDYNYITSSTPDSPLNSSLDYKASCQDIPAIFHQGGGKRGGIRLDSNGIQDLSLLLSPKSSCPKSPLSSYSNSTRVSNRHSIQNSPSNRIRHLSLSNSLSKSISYSHPENDIEGMKSSLKRADATISSKYSTPDTSIDPSYTDYGNRNNTVTDDIGHLLHLLLSISEKYDFTRLKKRLVCNMQDQNPHSGKNARLCYDYLNTGVCKREQMNGICRFRHLAPNNIESVVDKIRNGKMPICLIQQQGLEFIVADMPSCNSSPGELNPYASPDAELCLEYNLKGVCTQAEVGKCPYRHLVDCHPERIALLYRYGQLTDYEANAWLLSPCVANDVNPFATPSEKICYDFVNTGLCKRTQEGKICRFRHSLTSVDSPGFVGPTSFSCATNRPNGTNGTNGTNGLKQSNKPNIPNKQNKQTEQNDQYDSYDPNPTCQPCKTYNSNKTR